MEDDRSLAEQQKETKLQIDRLQKEYQMLKKGSGEAIAISATISMLYVEYAITQKKIIDMLDHWLAYQRRENGLLKTPLTGRRR